MSHTLLLHKIIIFQSRISNDVDFMSDCSSCRWLITSNHNNLNTCLFTFQDRHIDSWSWRIIQWYNTNKSKIEHWEPSLDWWISLLHVLPFFPVLNVKLVLWILCKDFRIKFAFGKSQYSFSHFTEWVVGKLNMICIFLERSFFTIYKDLIASIQNSFWCSFQEYTQVILSWFWLVNLLIHVSDKHVELDFRVEWNQCVNNISILFKWEYWEFIPLSFNVLNTLWKLDNTCLWGISNCISFF